MKAFVCLNLRIICTQHIKIGLNLNVTKLGMSSLGLYKPHHFTSIQGEVCTNLTLYGRKVYKFVNRTEPYNVDFSSIQGELGEVCTNLTRPQT